MPCIKAAVYSGQEAAIRSDFVSHEGDSLVIENEFMNKMKFISTYNPNQFESFWQSILQFPLSNLDDKLDELLSINKAWQILVLWGDRDSTVPFDPNFDRWKRALESKVTEDRVFRFSVYPNLGHSFFLENSHLCSYDILNFLKGRTDRTVSI